MLSEMHWRYRARNSVRHPLGIKGKMGRNGHVTDRLVKNGCLGAVGDKDERMASPRRAAIRAQCPSG
jgi:hypothetical protein